MRGNCNIFLVGEGDYGRKMVPVYSSGYGLRENVQEKARVKER